jgi:phenylacetyl-CoA:acceptor oxidoreductase 26-kDa subunit
MSFGPHPWQQTHWDARAAGNFIGGGAGSGLIVAAFASGAVGSLRATLIVLAMVLIGGGLACVWAEIGRPWRAFNVMFNPRTSWMSREAVLAPLLLGSAALMLAGVDVAGGVAALTALAFLLCQANILRAARGIAAWREPLTVPLIVLSGVAEGAGLFAALAALWGRGSASACIALAVLLSLRVAIGIAWRRRVGHVLRGPALQALAHLRIASRVAGPLPLAIVLAALLLQPAPIWLDALQLLAGALAVAGGAAFKLALITRTAFNQGFALPHLPVRGTR